jgi:hypothetical protein
MTEGREQKVKTLREVAEHFDTPLRTVENWVVKGMPREKKGPKKYIYDIGDIEEWVDDNIEQFNEYDKGPVFLWRYKYMCAIAEAEALRRIVNYIATLVKILRENFSEDKELIKAKAILNYLEPRLKRHDDEMKRYCRIVYRQIKKDVRCVN